MPCVERGLKPLGSTCPLYISPAVLEARRKMESGPSSLRDTTGILQPVLTPNHDTMRANTIGSLMLLPSFKRSRRHAAASCHLPCLGLREAKCKVPAVHIACSAVLLQGCRSDSPYAQPPRPVLREDLGCITQGHDSPPRSCPATRRTH